MIVVYEQKTRTIIAYLPGFPPVSAEAGVFTIIGTHDTVTEATDTVFAYRYFHDGEVPALYPGPDDEEEYTAPTLDDLELIPLTYEEIDTLLNPRDVGAEVDEIKVKVQQLETRVDALATKPTPSE